MENKLYIEMTDNGFQVMDGSTPIIQGIPTFDVACELHELIFGEQAE